MPVLVCRMFVQFNFIRMGSTDRKFDSKGVGVSGLGVKG